MSIYIKFTIIQIVKITVYHFEMVKNQKQNSLPKVSTFENIRVPNSCPNSCM